MGSDTVIWIKRGIWPRPPESRWERLRRYVRTRMRRLEIMAEDVRDWYHGDNPEPPAVGPMPEIKIKRGRSVKIEPSAEGMRKFWEGIEP